MKGKGLENMETIGGVMVKEKKGWKCLHGDGKHETRVKRRATGTR